MRSRLSAAYKGIHALLMQEGAKDFRTGQTFDQTIFFDEDVDIHHIFPQDWCSRQGIEPKVYDSIINKTPLSYRTNRRIGGVAPSVYLRLEAGQRDDPPISSVMMDGYLQTHCIDPNLLRADAFDKFMSDRERRLLVLIAKATGNDTVAAGGPSAAAALSTRNAMAFPAVRPPERRLPLCRIFSIFLSRCARANASVKHSKDMAARS
jgi:hypothetical protein